MSPYLFNLCICDVVKCISRIDYALYFLMSTTVIGLLRGFNAFHSYYNNFCWEINGDKTNVLFFQKLFKNSKEEKWFGGGGACRLKQPTKQYLVLREAWSRSDDQTEQRFPHSIY